MRKHGVWMALVAAMLVPSSVSARWFEASSDHFVVYADDNEKDLQRFTEQLERYHKAMDILTGSQTQKPSSSNRVTVYVVKNEAEVRKLMGKGASRWLNGFYIPRASGSIAIIPKVDAARGDTNGSMLTLLHEYAHHFLIGSSTMIMPRWFSEGAAEFYSSTKFENDGGISIGRPANHRAGELLFAKDVKVHDLLDPEHYEKRKNDKSYDAFYGKSWLLYHYLVFEPSRKGQLKTYLTKLSQGVPLVEAGKAAFGDFDVLEKEVDSYLKQRRMKVINLKPEMVPIGAVSFRSLGEGEAKMMPVLIQSKRGVDKETAATNLTEARTVASQYPNDAAVQSALAEAEYDVGNDKEAIAAADKAIAADPKQVNAYVQKGYALFRIAENADDQDAAYKEARKPFVALNKLENDHPLPLIYYYRSYAAQGKPPELAVQGLERAVQLAPFDMGLRFNLAQQYIRDNKMDYAKAMLRPVAYNPHGGGLAAGAQKIIEKIEEGKVTASDGDETVEEDSEDSAE